jgi:hypothetical protein
MNHRTAWPLWSLWSWRARAGIVVLCWLLTACTGLPAAVDPLPPTSPALDNPLIPTPRAPAAVVTLPAPGLPAVAAPAETPSLPTPYSLRWRMGAAVPDGRSPDTLPWPTLRPGWYLNWSTGHAVSVQAGTAPTQPLTSTLPLTVDALVVPPDAAVGMEFVPLVWVSRGELSPTPEVLTALVTLLPGRTWLIGNEPDVRWQGNSTPAEYAQAYHLAHTTIKAADPTAQVAIGGVSQVTPLRLAYLDAALAAYAATYGAPMPVDVWNMHAFILQEKVDDWGVEIPPGLDATQGVLWTIDQHDDLAILEAQVRRMRAWMQAQGQQDKPLWITEYGILMPADYGFGPERVRAFMLGSFDLLRTLADPALGYAADEYRLVQRWMWFSTDDVIYPTGNLFTPTGQPTGLLAALEAYLAEFGAAGP